MKLGAPRYQIGFVAILTAHLFGGSWVSAVSAQVARDEAALLDFFERKVRPVLADNCYNCHSASNKALGGLRVDDRNGLLHGGERGPALLPGQPDKSLLIQAVRRVGKLKMPPEKQITPEEVAILEEWVRTGAVWPQAVVPRSVGKYKEKYEKLRKEHWAWQPLREPATPAVKDAAWPRSDVDRFLLARLEAKGLRPVADADRVTLLRRVTFDLTGLPPTPEDIEAFIQDSAGDERQRTAALEKVVDRLLASPAYGERWGRHWLDVARYADSTGSARNLPYPHAWRYRNYVLDAFRHDKPYDEFLREQIAGDLLPTSASDTEEDRQQRLIATGFLALGVKDVNQRFKVRFVMDNVDEMIDTVTRSVLALTASCARCHDHKFDPVPTTDYYALAGIFLSTDHCAGLRNKMGGGGLDYYDPSLLLRLGPSAPNPKVGDRTEQLTKAIAAAKAEVSAGQGTGKGQLKQTAARLRLKKLQAELIALNDPALRGPVAMGVREAKTVGDTELRIRGEAEKLGPVVPRGFLSLIDVPDVPRINPQQSGRLELAQWLTSTKNPLTPRVMVNRVWHHLFGQGIVASVDNFGVTGEAPSHPELLDHLAVKFQREGWSVKTLVRSLVLTRAYQLASEAPATHRTIDPANRLVWRHSPRRLDAEEIRDATLAASGQLKLDRPEPGSAKDLKVVELRNNGAEATRLAEEAESSVHRSVYLPLLRTLTPRALEVFDFAEQGMVTGSRDATTVAPQALYLLNDPFVTRQTAALAGRLLKRSELEGRDRVRLAYRLTLNRDATDAELERAERYLALFEADARNEGSKQSNDSRTTAWARFTQALIASAEFRYVQ